jgi:DNA repair exonuclease SbcCD ATPase subunit
MRKPNDWYQMSYEQQRSWEKQNRALEDLEYEKDRAREEAERSDRHAHELKRDLERAKSERDERVDERVDEVDALEEELSTYRRFIEAEALEQQFNAWAANDRAGGGDS